MQDVAEPAPHAAQQPERTNVEPMKRGEVIKKLKRLQELKIEDSLNDIISKKDLDPASLKEIKRWTSYDPTDITDATLLSFFHPSTQKLPLSKEVFQMSEHLRRIGLKFYFSYLRAGLEEMGIKGLVQNREAPSLQPLVDEIFLSLARVNPLDHVDTLTEAGAEIFKQMRETLSIDQYHPQTKRYTQAIDISLALGDALRSKDFGQIIIEINRLKALQHVTGPFVELTSNDLVRSAIVESISRSREPEAIRYLYDYYSSNEVKMILSKLLHEHKDAYIQTYTKYFDSGNKRIDEDKVFEKIWYEIASNELKNKGRVNLNAMKLIFSQEQAIEIEMMERQGNTGLSGFKEPTYEQVLNGASRYIRERLMWKINHDSPVRPIIEAEQL